MFNNKNYLGDKLEAREEKLSLAALSAIVASVGGETYKSEHALDSWGVDAICVFKGRFTEDRLEESLTSIYAQLKSTRAPQSVKKNGRDCWALPVDVKQLRRYTEGGKNLFLALFITPGEEEQESWVTVDAESISVRKALYWTFVKGFQIDETKAQNTIHIPKENLLTPAALVKLVADAKSGKGFYNV